MKNLCLNKSAARQRGGVQEGGEEDKAVVGGKEAHGTLGWRSGAVAIGATT